MQHEFRGRTLQEVIGKATGRAPSRKQIPEVYAPPLIWGPWHRVMDVWASPGGNIHFTISYSTIAQAPSTFDIEIAHGQGHSDVLRTTGPGSTSYMIPRGPDYSAIVTSIDIRARSHSLGQGIDVQASYDTAKNRAENDKLYIWETQSDDRVRPSHADNHGKIFSWDDPPDTGHPGEDYGCRCRAKPLSEGN